MSEQGLTSFLCDLQPHVYIQQWVQHML